MTQEEFSKMENFVRKAKNLLDSMKQLDEMVAFLKSFPDSTLEIKGTHYPDDCITKGIDPIEQTFSDRHLPLNECIKSDFISLLKNHRRYLERKFDEMQISQLDDYTVSEDDD